MSYRPEYLYINIMVKDIIRYSFVAILLSIVAWLFSLMIARVLNLDRVNCHAIEDLLFVLFLVSAFLKLKYIDLQDTISVKRFSVGVLIVAFVCLTAISYVVDISAALFNISIEEQTQMEMDVVRHPFALFTVSVIAPITEEIIFRGAILRRMLQSSKQSPWVAIVCSAALFSAGHIFSVMIANALFVGLLFGWLYYKTRSLLLTIYLHLANNTLYSIILLTPLRDVQYTQMSTWVVIVSIVFLAALSFVCLLWLNANFKKVISA